jgi:hypothetical protein
MKMTTMKLGNTPRPTAWSPPLASFRLPVQLSPSSCGGGFLVNGVGRMIGCGDRQRRDLLIDRGGARSKGTSN